MLLGSGILIETVEARVKPLERVLKSYIEKKFTGYVTYRNDVQGVYVTIAIIEGSIAGCKSIERGVVYEGIECCGVAMRYLYEPEGVIEVHDIQRGIIILDLVVSPLSRVERASALTSALGARVGIPMPEVITAPPTEVVVAPPVKVVEAKPEVETKPVLAPTEIKPVEPMLPPQPQLPPTPAPPQPKPASGVVTTQVKPIEKPVTEITISNECIDPVTLYMVMRSSQLLEVLADPRGFQEIVDKIKSIAMEKKPSYVYVSSVIENTTIRIIYDVNSRNVNIELERNGSIICGNDALRELGDKKIVGTKIWYVA